MKGRGSKNIDNLNSGCLPQNERKSASASYGRAYRKFKAKKSGAMSFTERLKANRIENRRLLKVSDLSTDPKYTSLAGELLNMNRIGKLRYPNGKALTNSQLKDYCTTIFARYENDLNVDVLMGDSDNKKPLFTAIDLLKNN